jgi:ABC-type sulfate transport system permease subunit
VALFSVTLVALLKRAFEQGFPDCASRDFDPDAIAQAVLAVNVAFLKKMMDRPKLGDDASVVLIGIMQMDDDFAGQRLLCAVLVPFPLRRETVSGAFYRID